MKVQLTLLISLLCLSFFLSPSQARYYDAEQGRFLTPDAIVARPNDPQNLNRYVYVRNNPINFTDPSGHSWVSQSFRKGSNWVKENPEITGLIIQPFDVFSGSALLASTSDGRAILAGQALAGASFGVGGNAAGWGAISGEIPGFYSAKKRGKSTTKGVLVEGVKGAVIGRLMGNISELNLNWASKAVIKSQFNALLTATEGGSIQDIGLAYGATFGAEGLNAYFEHVLDYQANPNPGVPLEKPFYHYRGLTPEEGLDVFGTNTIKKVTNMDFFHQGHPAMRTLSAIPGMQAISQIHDAWLNPMHLAKSYLFGSEFLTNIFTMPPAAVVAYGAILSTHWSPLISQYHQYSN